MDLPRVGILGATSLVADGLLPMLQDAYGAVPFSRRNSAGDTPAGQIPYWISLIPISVLPDYFERIEAAGATRVVALSSTSVFTKKASSDPAEQHFAAQFAENEQRFVAWAERRGIEWVILRPTLIYGRGRDRNVSEIARFIRRFRFFPAFGAATGLRQPIHVDDVALACRRALEAGNAANRSYNISGGETLTYRDMVTRIFEALGTRARFITTPLWAFNLAVACVKVLPRFHDWSPAMAERMNQDMTFDHGAATRDLGLSPRPFRPTIVDIAGESRRAPAPDDRDRRGLK